MARPTLRDMRARDMVKHSRYTVPRFAGVVDLPPSLAPSFLQLDIAGALGLGVAGIVFTFFLV